MFSNGDRLLIAVCSICRIPGTEARCGLARLEINKRLIERFEIMPSLPVSELLGRVSRPRKITLVVLAIMLCTTATHAQTNKERSPSDTVREFYKAMREHRFKEAWSLTMYKSAVETLTAEEMEDLRPDFEDRAAKVPEQVEITGEQINGNIATVFVKVPNDAEATQTVSEPVALFSSGGSWIIGNEADQEVVKKAGRRYFL